ncbi:TAXI family TRAP transporter solute-binding subunit [uncultured Desulfovibrio sp.]|uniref:TAXI family TRAP transporter solute-binding subunit n=1 Tax=uncultured Desulfovibrio sp. TaxID=167968 RepID=UPI002604117E|nr:TAXI family TRAP transporter solute-binding subunit [uncultured Desulfovibrio sp.]
MKKIMSLFLACGLLLGAASAALADGKRLTLATGGTSGVYFPLGGAIAQVISTKSDGKFSVTAQATGASGENMRLVQANDVDFAMVQNDVADAAYKGTPPFRPDNKMTDVMAMGRLYPEYLHVVASTDSGVKKLEDFKGKKVSVGARGSGNEVNCRQIFQYFGLDYKNVEPIFLPYGETADQFKDRQLDGFVFTIGTPNPAIQDITTAQSVQFIPVEGAKVDELVGKFPFLVKDAIPAGTYKGQDKPVPTLSVQCILIVNKNMSDDDVYAMTKALYENLDDVAKAHNKGTEISVAHAADGITIPFHPGAARYFAEKGIKLPQ